MYHKERRKQNQNAKMQLELRSCLGPERYSGYQVKLAKSKSNDDG